MATKTAPAVVIPQPTDEEINSMGCWGPPPPNSYVTRKAFTYRGQEIPAGISIIVENVATARKLIQARLLINPMGVL